MTELIVVAIVSSVVTGGVSSIGTIQYMRGRMDAMQGTIQRLDSAINKIHDDFYRPRVTQNGEQK